MAIASFCQITPEEAKEALQVLHPIELLAEAAKARQEAFSASDEAHGAISEARTGVPR